MKRVLITITILSGLAALQGVEARETLGLPVKSQGLNPNSSKNKLMKYAANCDAASASADLDINNVRAKILNGGDMWWDLSNPKYEVPKLNDNSGVRKHSVFAGALWIGGRDEGGNLKLAAMTYRQRGSDFWPGPLDTITGTTDNNRCKYYDKMYQVTRKELLDYEESGFAVASDNIYSWPGNGNTSNNEPGVLAPFFDNGTTPGLYEPGDYPVLDPYKPASINQPKDQPDKMLWFVYNDQGNIHSESGGVPIGLELQTTAFAFATNDELNNTTFYKNRIVNRSSSKLFGTYFGQWCDPDLGNYADDYIGCDVGLSLGYCYNGDDDDEGVLGYGLNPPTVGIDFFQGPIDTNKKELGLSKFMYFTNGAPYPTQDPNTAIEFYNFLQGKFQNGQSLKYGGTGLNGTADCNFAFPENTDPAFPGQTWTEKTAGNKPGDRRFVQSSGPFVLEPGAVQYVTVGVVWARTTSGGATGSLSLLKRASRKAQELFDAGFRTPAGPDAPDLEIIELDQELAIAMKGTEPIEKKYAEAVNNSTAPGGAWQYRFQGYMIYQLSDATVSQTDLNNTQKARLVYQSDIKDNIDVLVNKEPNPFNPTGSDIDVVKVEGVNAGVGHTLSLKEDAFATGSDKSLVNFKSYYYMVIAYAYPANDTSSIATLRFLAGRTNVKVYKAVPHKSEPKGGGTLVQSEYGDGPFITRIEGSGNGGNVLDFTAATINEILGPASRSLNPTYIGGRGPIDVKVVDPTRVPKGNFKVVIVEKPLTNVSDSSVSDSSSWFMVRYGEDGVNDTVYSDTSIRFRNEQLIAGAAKGTTTAYDWGLSVTITQTKNPGDENDATNGFLEATVEWQDNTKQWLTAMADVDNVTGAPWLNWIRSGQNGKASSPPYNNIYTDDYSVPINGVPTPLDPFEVYEKLWNGRIAPFVLASRTIQNSSDQRNATIYGVGADVQFKQTTLRNLASVDLVITPDKSKWTRCIVVDQGEDALLNEGGVKKMNMRKGTSKDQNGNPESTIGQSWFPGYAMNLETGERLNIIFSEDSYQAQNNGRDMLWNPNSANAIGTSSYLANGGRHYIYIMGSYNAINGSYKGPIYDGGQDYYNLYTQAYADPSKEALNRSKVWSQCMWAIPSYMANGYSMNNGVPPTEVRFRLRVNKSYAAYPTQTPSENFNNPVYIFKTDEIAAQASRETGKKAVEMINVVPNPYYAYSQYETSPIDNRVKITNLPRKCTISIFTMNGSLVRRIKKDDDLTYVDWDLKNNASVPIASGMYIIHVDAGDLGEKVLKWYGIMRTIDLDSY